MEDRDLVDAVFPGHGIPTAGEEVVQALLVNVLIERHEGALDRVGREFVDVQVRGVGRCAGRRRRHLALDAPIPRHDLDLDVDVVPLILEPLD